MDADRMANFTAFGGPLQMNNNDGMSAIEYDFMDRYLTNYKNKYQNNNDGMTSMFAGTPSTMFGEGGGLSRSDDYGSKKKPYPSVSKGDFLEEEEVIQFLPRLMLLTL